LDRSLDRGEKRKGGDRFGFGILADGLANEERRKEGGTIRIDLRASMEPGKWGRSLHPDLCGILLRWRKAAQCFACGPRPIVAEKRKKKKKKKKKGEGGQGAGPRSDAAFEAVLEKKGFSVASRVSPSYWSGGEEKGGSSGFITTGERKEETWFRTALVPARVSTFGKEEGKGIDARQPCRAGKLRKGGRGMGVAVFSVGNCVPSEPRGGKKGGRSGIVASLSYFTPRDVGKKKGKGQIWSFDS